MLLLIISFLVIAAYTAAVCIKAKGVPYSISATYYAIEHKGWFRFTMWACPMVLMPVILEVSKPGTEFLAYLALAGMIVVGCFPDYKADKFQYRGHIAGAMMAIRALILSPNLSLLVLIHILPHSEHHSSSLHL